MNEPPEQASFEELVGLSPRSTVSEDYLGGASPQMSEDEDAAEAQEDPPPDNMPESSHPSSMVCLTMHASCLSVLLRKAVYLVVVHRHVQHSGNKLDCKPGS